MSDDDAPDWIDIEGLAESDPMRAAALNHLESAEEIPLAAIERAIEKNALTMVQNLYDASQDGDDPAEALARMGVLKRPAPEEVEAAEEAKSDAPVSAPNDA